MMLKAGANPDVGLSMGLGLLLNRTPLHGANPDVGMSIGLGLMGSWTTLYCATQNGHKETMEMLLKAGANLDAGMSIGLGLLSAMGVGVLTTTSLAGRTMRVVSLSVGQLAGHCQGFWVWWSRVLSQQVRVRSRALCLTSVS